MKTRQLRYLWLVPVLLIALLLAACSSAETPDFEVRIISIDVAVGLNRVSFILFDEQRQVRLPEAEITTYLVSDEDDPDAKGELRGTATAKFRQWPVGSVGVYGAQLNLDTPGLWRAEVTVVEQDGKELTGEGFFNVAPRSFTPSIGAPAPRSITKTLQDVQDLKELTTAREPDLDMYRITIAEAIDTGKPLMLVFATPALCESLTCGPQVEEIQALKAAYQGEVNFIHVEIYDNPHEIQGDFDNAIFSPAVLEWGLPNEPWTFIVDSQGRIADKFEGFTNREELAEALDGTLR